MLNKKTVPTNNYSLQLLRRKKKVEVIILYMYFFPGHYIYIEASTPRHPGDIARLTSPWFPSDVSAQCFQFWYHMNGPNEINGNMLYELFLLLYSRNSFYIPS